ncbi:probable calcium-binding protein CML46 [Amaranthus tricolor]|uniref:probable calcium-binding protein CML46 n=1 Tax=Amaranthus tricolor TaxID=29722 RepID=UPI0025871A74|nr:probable calcium-binding protein CML46 [Amaranthus tricolor]
MEKASSSISHNTLLSNLLDFSLLYSIVYDFQQSISCFFHHKSSSFCDFEPKLDDKKKNYDVGKKDLEHLVSKNGKNEGDYCLFGHDINLVMERLGIQKCVFEGDEEVEKKCDFDEISDLFEEEPSLEEVKEAFDVFDQNKDGFIDAQELLRVLEALGLRQGQGYELHECNNMINAFNTIKDGKLGFNDFVRFMLNTL